MQAGYVWRYERVWTYGHVERHEHPTQTGQAWTRGMRAQDAPNTHNSLSTDGTIRCSTITAAMHDSLCGVLVICSRRSLHTYPPHKLPLALAHTHTRLLLVHSFKLRTSVSRPIHA